MFQADVAGRLDHQRDPHPGADEGQQAVGVGGLLGDPGREARLVARLHHRVAYGGAAGGGEGHEPLLSQLGQLHPLPFHQRVGVGQGEEQVLDPHGPGVDAAPRGEGHEAQVKRPVGDPPQRLPRVGLALQHQLDAGEFGGDGAGQHRQRRIAAGPREADGDPAHLARSRSAHGPAYDGGLGEQVPRRFEEGLPGRGQPHRPGRTVEQRDAQIALQQSDLLAQRRLGHVQPLGGAPEVQLLRDGDESGEMT